MATLKELQDQMKKNSDAWHGASKAEQDRLHQENQNLQKQIDSMTGGSSSFNSSSGKWTTSTPESGSGTLSTGQKAANSASGITVNTGTQEQIKAQMNANSNAWHTASLEEKKRLEEANRQLASQLNQNGGSVSFDPGSGTWSGTAGSMTTPRLPVQEDLSDYLTQMHEAQKRAALAQINNAYQQNVNAINRAGEGVDTRYQNARNQAAGASELAARNFNEYAAASGLNSGAGGQAELARNVALQNSLGDIDTAEAQTYADLELQLANAETEYNNAIAEAEANGDAALAAALYQEKVRVQEGVIQTMMQQWQMDLQSNQFQYKQQQDAAGDQLANRQQLAQYGNAWLENGLMPSQEMLSAMGITAQDAQAYIDQLSLRASLEAQRQQAGGSGSGSESGNRDGAGTLSFSTAKSLAEAGYFDDAVLNTLRANGMADAAITAMYGWTPDAAAPTGQNGGGDTQVTNKNGSGWVYVPGFGRITYQELEHYVDTGEITETFDPNTGKYTYRKA